MTIQKRVHVKWIGPNEPMIRLARNDARLYLNKRELLALRDEIDEFAKYYSEDFSESRIDVETPPEEFPATNWAIRDEEL